MQIWVYALQILQKKNILASCYVISFFTTPNSDWANGEAVQITTDQKYFN